eukprot:2235342-Karenia_brevis.AAC.1
MAPPGSLAGQQLTGFHFTALSPQQPNLGPMGPLVTFACGPGGQVLHAVVTLVNAAGVVSRLRS